MKRSTDLNIVHITVRMDISCVWGQIETKEPEVSQGIQHISVLAN